MAYLFLALAIAAGVTKGFCGKRISAYTSEFKSAAYSNLIRMLICIFIGFFFVLFDGGISQFRASGTLILVSAISGVTTAAFVVFWLFAVRRGAYVLVDVFLTLGTLISSVLSIIFYDETIDAWDVIGFLILFAAILVMCSYSTQIKTKITVGSIGVLLLAGISSGLSDFSKKMFSAEVSGYGASVFNFYTFAFAAAVLLLVFLFSKRTEKSAENIRHLSRHGLIYISLMAVCLFLNSFFKTLAAKTLNMSVMAPLSQGSALVLVTVMSALFFGEKIKPRCIIGIILAITGLLVMNLL